VEVEVGADGHASAPPSKAAAAAPPAGALIIECIGGAGVRVPLVHELLAPRECDRF
jgi:hypothetical protein